jgi:hypothetical protein
VALAAVMASVVHLLAALPNLRAYTERMYARPKGPQRIAQAFASFRGEEPAPVAAIGRPPVAMPAASRQATP